MTPSAAPADLGTSVLVHLSGPNRGLTERLQGEDLTVPGGEAPWAHLHRRGSTYELEAAPDKSVWVNGERVDRLVLASGDVIELGRGGPVIRFRRYPPGRRPFKSLGEVFVDCWDCARYERAGPLRKTGVFLAGIPTEIARQTNAAFRVSVVGTLVILAVATGFLISRTLRVEQTLTRQAQEVQGLAGLVNRAGANPTTAGELRRMLDDVQATLAATEQRVDSLESRSQAAGKVIAVAARSTVFIQGAYGFEDPESGRPMRWVLDSQDRPVRGPDGEPLVTTEGTGPVVELFYTGTGFVAEDGGLVITNRHIAQPWEADESVAQVTARGWRPVLLRLRGYLPSVARPFNVTIVAVADSADLAVMRCDGAARSVPPLRLRRNPPSPGDEVLVLGYPLGIEAVLARADARAIQELQRAPDLDFWTVAERLSAAGQLTPLASRGIVGQVTSRAVTYDAATSHGGSGGPVLTLQGEVVAVNSAGLPDFGGSNLGVPTPHLLALLDRTRSR